MTKLDKARAGDKARVYMTKSGQISEFYRDDRSDFILCEFDIIAVGKNNTYNTYYILVSYKNENYYASSTINLNDMCYSPDWNIDEIIDKSPNLSKYHNHRVRWLDKNRVFEIVKGGPDGCSCKVCREFYDMAVPNQPDGTLICYSCRQNPMRAYY